MSAHYGRDRIYTAPQGLWLARVVSVGSKTAHIKFDDINPADEFVAALTETAKKSVGAGDHVLCAFLNGRIDQPVVVDRLANAPVRQPDLGPPVVVVPDLGIPVVVHPDP